MWLQLALTPKRESLETQFSFYASYHHDFANQIIHIIFVWPILWTALLFMAYTPSVVEVTVGSEVVPLHPCCAIFALTYIVYYVLLERPAGIGAAILAFVCWATVEWMARNQDYEVFRWSAILHGVCWVSQFLGHGIFEKRAPALIDNLAQSFFMAPFFVLLEGLSWCGYRRDMFQRMNVTIEENICAFQKSREVLNAPTTEERQ